MINGVMLKKLVNHVDERGYLFEGWHQDDGYMEYYYVCAAWPDKTKAWHYHKVHTDRFVCVTGIAKVQLVDLRSDSTTLGEVMKVILLDCDPHVLIIPPGVAHGFKGLGCKAVIINSPDRKYDDGKDEFRIESLEKAAPLTKGSMSTRLGENGTKEEIMLPAWEEKIW